MKKKSRSSAKSKAAVAAGDDGDSDGKNTAATSKGSSSQSQMAGMLPPIMSSDMIGRRGDGPWHDVTGNPGVTQADGITPVLSSFLKRSTSSGGGGGDSSKRGGAAGGGGGGATAGGTPNRHNFEGFARVFFQGRSDKTARQLLPSELNDTVTSDSYIYVTVDPDKSTLVLYPYRANDEDRSSADPCRPLIDPPIDLVDFKAEQLSNSVCGAALYVRREAEEDPEAPRRHVFRFEFRNDCVLQSQERIQQLQFASKKAIQVTKKEGKNMQKAAVNFFSSHDDVEVARQLAEQKLQDSYSHYLREIRAMQQEASSLARRFVKIVNDVSDAAVDKAAAAAAAAPSVVSSVVQQQLATTKPFGGGRKKKPTRRARAEGDASDEGTDASVSFVEDTDTSDGPSQVS